MTDPQTEVISEICAAEREFAKEYWIFPTSREQAASVVDQPGLWPNGEPTPGTVLDYLHGLRSTPLEPGDTYEHRAAVICWYRRWWACKILLDSDAGKPQPIHPGVQAEIDWEAEHGPRRSGFDGVREYDPTLTTEEIAVIDEDIRRALTEDIDKEILEQINTSLIGPNWKNGSNGS